MKTSRSKLTVALLIAACSGELARAPLEPPPLDAMEGRKGWSIADEDRTDGTSDGVLGLIGRVHSVDRVLDVLGARMDAINASFGPPPDDSREAFRAVLSQIQATAQYVYGVATFLLACGDVSRPPSIAGTSGSVAEADVRDSDDTSTEALLGRLGSVANVLGALAKRMDDIDAAATGICLPEAGPEPWSPPTATDMLVSIQAGALNVVRLAEEMLT